MSQQSQTSIKERTVTQMGEPKRYKVIMHNDDFTTMEFVVMVLAVVFGKTEAEAKTIMLQIHNNNQAVVGVYCYDIACTKARKAMLMARQQNFPLRITLSEA